MDCAYVYRYNDSWYIKCAGCGNEYTDIGIFSTSGTRRGIFSLHYCNLCFVDIVRSGLGVDMNKTKVLHAPFYDHGGFIYKPNCDGCDDDNGVIKLVRKYISGGSHTLYFCKKCFMDIVYIGLKGTTDGCEH